MPDQPNESESASAVVEAPKAKPASRPELAPVDSLPPWRVLLHNDDHNDMGFVVETLCMLTNHNQATAVQTTLTAHTRGVALVTMTHKERAELYQDQFKSRGLTVTIEPDEQ